MVDSEENDKFDLGVKGLRDRVTIYHTIYYPFLFFSLKQSFKPELSTSVSEFPLNCHLEVVDLY